jgi:hypothetical protein
VHLCNGLPTFLATLNIRDKGRKCLYGGNKQYPGDTCNFLEFLKQVVVLPFFSQSWSPSTGSTTTAVLTLRARFFLFPIPHTLPIGFFFQRSNLTKCQTQSKHNDNIITSRKADSVRHLIPLRRRRMVWYGGSVRFLRRFRPGIDRRWGLEKKLP